jgi:hypothetical protein
MTTVSQTNDHCLSDTVDSDNGWKTYHQGG